MSRLLFSCCLSLAILMSAGTVAALEPTPDNAAQVSRLVAMSGTRDLFQELPAVLKSAVADPEQRDMSAQTSDSIAAAVDRHIRPADLTNAVESEVLRQLGPEDLRAVLTWFQSDLGGRIVAMHAGTSADEEEYLNVIGKLSQDLARVELTRRVVELTEVSDYAFEIQMYTNIAMAEAVAEAFGPEAEIDAAQVRAQWEGSRVAIAAALQKDGVRNLLYMLRALSLAEVTQYVEFLETEPARRYHHAVRTATVRAMQNGIKAFAGDLSRILAREEAPAP